MTDLEKAEKFAEYMWDATKTKVKILKTFEEFIEELKNGGDMEFDQEKSKLFFKNHACFRIIGKVPPGLEDDMLCIPHSTIKKFVRTMNVDDE